jgi:hypothetical protein
MRSLQKFVSIHASVFNHFNKERHLNSRDTYEVQRQAALIEWQQLCAAENWLINAILRRVRIRLTAPPATLAFGVLSLFPSISFYTPHCNNRFKYSPAIFLELSLNDWVWMRKGSCVAVLQILYLILLLH